MFTLHYIHMIVRKIYFRKQQLIWLQSVIINVGLYRLHVTLFTCGSYLAVVKQLNYQKPKNTAQNADGLYTLL